MDKGFFTVVGYNKENNAYIEYEDFELSLEAEMYARELKKMLDGGELLLQSRIPVYQLGQESSFL